MLSALDLSGMIEDVTRLHAEYPKKTEKAFRKFDGRTPYAVHPILLAMLFLHEESLPEDLRTLGAKALLAHDLIEDTTATLPDWCLEPAVLALIHALTFEEHEDPFVEIWNRNETAILLKFFDNVANLMCVSKMESGRAWERKRKVLKHLAWIKKLYPSLEIVKIAEGLLADTKETTSPQKEDATQKKMFLLQSRFSEQESWETHRESENENSLREELHDLMNEDVDPQMRKQMPYFWRVIPKE